MITDLTTFSNTARSPRSCYFYKQHRLHGQHTGYYYTSTSTGTSHKLLARHMCLSNKHSTDCVSYADTHTHTHTHTHTQTCIHVTYCAAFGHCFQHHVVCFPVLTQRVWLDFSKLLRRSNYLPACSVIQSCVGKKTQQQYLPETE